MNNEDMSNLINKFSNFMNSSNSSDSSGNSSISPEFIANMAKMMQASKANSSQEDSSNTSSENSNNSSMPEFDMQTILKMKTVFDQMNKKDDPRSNLLLSLKPYLKESRKNKVEQYIQLFNISKVIDVFNQSSNGGSSK